jgi:anti-sigma factor ChrR (cupin superfamily)
MGWMPNGTEGIEIKSLYENPSFPDATRLERWSAGTSLGEYDAEDGFELFVLEGEFRDENGSYPVGSWLRLPAGSSHTPHTEGGCVLYRKTGALPHL